MTLHTDQMSDSFRIGAILAAVGGFLDAYTYLARGQVFANAQTGNIVLLGVHLSEGDFKKPFPIWCPFWRLLPAFLWMNGSNIVWKEN